MKAGVTVNVGVGESKNSFMLKCLYTSIPVLSSDMTFAEFFFFDLGFYGPF